MILRLVDRRRRSPPARALKRAGVVSTVYTCVRLSVTVIVSVSANCSVLNRRNRIAILSCQSVLFPSKLRKGKFARNVFVNHYPECLVCRALRRELNH